MATSGAPRTCLACEQTLASKEFRGQSRKRVTCRTCEEANAGFRWCLGCAGWAADENWYFDKTAGRPKGSRCRPCLTHSSHGVTRKFMAELTGFPTPQCSACGERERLSIDHDHSHCASETGCRYCVRGYLCRNCNVAEGLLGTVERAEALLEYMRRTHLTEADLNSLPPSPPSRRPARPSRKSATNPRKFYTYPTDATDAA